MSKTATASRLEARVSPYVHDLIKRAAELQGRTVTDFVVSAAEAAATRTISEHQVIALTLEDQKFFADMLLNPPLPNEALKRAAARHRKYVRSV